jgi:CYTH domain-containing protein
MTLNPERDLAAEMAEPKYAHFERERRWLVDNSARPDVASESFTQVEDRYLEGSRLRLRRMSRPGNSWMSCKLTKKYECDDPSIRPIVTAYLTEEEYALLRELSGSDLVKRRYRLDHGGQVWSLDIFEGALAGLELVEIEAADDEALAGLVSPPWALREITNDPRYQCGALARSQMIPEN